MLGVDDVNGFYPIADLQDSPSGRRYAIEETIMVHESGLVTHDSGVVEREYRQMTATEMRALAAHKTPFRPHPLAGSKFGVTLLEALAEPDRTKTLDLSIGLQIFETEPEYVTIQKEIARGTLVTHRDVEAKQRELLMDRESRVRAAQDRVSAEVEARGGTVVSRCRVLSCMSVRLDASHVRDVAASPAIASIGLVSATTRDADINGTQVVQGSQIKQFIDANFDGEYGTPDVSFAIIELDNYRDEHLAFNDTSLTTPRIHTRRSCTTISCTAVSFPDPPVSPATNAHATISLALIFGDLRDAQDPAHVTTLARVDRSGYAGEAWGHLIKSTIDSTALTNALDDAAVRLPIPRVINLSLSVAADDPNCLGKTALNQNVNDLFEQGQLVFKSGANTGHTSTTDCTVGSPGAAIGAFTVGGHGNSDVGTETDVRSGAIYSLSPRGGTTLEGNQRSIIDLTAFAHRKLIPSIVANNNYGASASGTSFSTPTVTAAAIDFIDFYKQANGGSNFIDQPGVLFVNMLLMGDRQGQAAKLNTGFDNLWGAGRMKMRMANAAGLDAPAVWKTGSTCVGTGGTFTVPINSGVALPNAVNDIKAAIFWYDRRHELGTVIDDIDLELHNVGGSTPLRSSASSWDNKERVYHNAIGGQAVELRIKGYDVTTGGEGCGTNRMLVYYAYFYEDDARDDVEGPFPMIIDVE